MDGCSLTGPGVWNRRSSTVMLAGQSPWPFSGPPWLNKWLNAPWKACSPDLSPSSIGPSFVMINPGNLILILFIPTNQKKICLKRIGIWIFDLFISRFKTCYQIALAIKDEVQDLEKAGIKIIQIDEAALREGLPLRKSEHAFYLDWAVHAFRITNVGVQDSTQVISVETLASSVFGWTTIGLCLWWCTDSHTHVLLKLQRHHQLHHRHGCWCDNNRELAIRREASVGVPWGNQVQCWNRSWCVRYPLSENTINGGNCRENQENGCGFEAGDFVGESWLWTEDAKVFWGEAGAI